MSLRQTSFNDATWGRATHSYAKLAHSLSNVKFNAITQAAQPFVLPKLDCVHNKATDDIEVISIDDNKDEQAHLVDNSDDEDECKLFLLNFHDLTDMII
jgi:hypothetical protein